jgi:hypothetical protein
MREHQRPVLKKGRNMFRRTVLQLTFLCAGLAAAQTLPPQNSSPDGDSTPLPTVVRLPTDVILVKGAEPSASDRVTPLPEDGSIVKNVFQNRYFGIRYPLPADWTESYKGPPPSDTGAYIFANILPAATFKGPIKGTVLFSAQDMFFGLTPAENAKELIAFRHEHLEEYYDVERQPSEITIAGRTFARFDYMSKVAGIHWAVLATQIRCHAVQLVFSSRDPELIESLVKDMDRMTLPAEAAATGGKGGGDWPLCVADYARQENIVEGIEPVLSDRKFNAIPVRIVVDKRGKVSHVHVLSAFPDQARIITDALMQWRFKPYMVDGKPVELETGVIFGAAPMQRKKPAASPAVTAAKTAD